MEWKEFDQLLKYAKEFSKSKDAESKENLKRIEEAVIKSNDPVFAREYASAIESSDKLALEQIVVNSKDGILAYHFAKDVGVKDIKALQQVVC